MLNGWLSRHSTLPNDVGYFESSYEDFFKNPASAYKIGNWKLKRIQRVHLESGDASRDDVKVGTIPENAPVRYRLTFGVPNGDYNVSLLFYPDDNVYYCNYETKDKIEDKKKLPTDRGYSPVVQYTEFYPQGDIKLSDIPCSLEGKTQLARRTDTIKGIVNFIKLESGKSNNPWKRLSSSDGGSVWRVDNIKNGLHINYVFDYKFGVPTLVPNLGSDNAGLRVVEVREINDDLWELIVVQENRGGGLFSSSHPTIKLYATGGEKVSVCS
jgi:hypothetical protein